MTIQSPGNYLCLHVANGKLEPTCAECFWHMRHSLERDVRLLREEIHESRARIHELLRDDARTAALEEAAGFVRHLIRMGGWAGMRDAEGFIRVHANAVGRLASDILTLDGRGDAKQFRPFAREVPK